MSLARRGLLYSAHDEWNYAVRADIKSTAQPDQKQEQNWNVRKYGGSEQKRERESNQRPEEKS